MEDLKSIGVNLHVIDASDMFYNGSTTIADVQTDLLKNVTKPEVKRKIIGDTFMRVADSIVKKMVCLCLFVCLA